MRIQKALSFDILNLPINYDIYLLISQVLQGAVAFSAEAFLCIDVYALALVLWELLSRCTLHQGPLVEGYRAPYEEEVMRNPIFYSNILQYFYFFNFVFDSAILGSPFKFTSCDI